MVCSKQQYHRVLFSGCIPVASYHKPAQRQMLPVMLHTGAKSLTCTLSRCVRGWVGGWRWKPLLYVRPAWL